MVAAIPWFETLMTAPTRQIFFIGEIHNNNTHTFRCNLPEEYDFEQNFNVIYTDSKRCLVLINISCPWLYLIEYRSKQRCPPIITLSFLDEFEYSPCKTINLKCNTFATAK